MEHWIDRLSAYVDGDLSSAEAEAVKEHLDACAECAAVLEDLQEVVRRAEMLEERPPARDLWPEIEAEIRNRAPRPAEVGDRVEGVVDQPRRWIRMSVPQLVAAGVALAFLSGGAAWTLRGGLESSAGGTAGLRSLSAVRSATAEGLFQGLEDHATEIQRLRSVLEEHRDRLAPATVRVLERNLAIIDRAIAESREALEEDPENEYLMQHLEATLLRKLRFLREATTTLETAT